MKRILITGASGQLGRVLKSLLSQREEYQVIYTGSSASEDGTVQALDITDETVVNQVIANTRPDIIINTAAMTAVDLCESEQDRAYRVNALGPKYLALAAEKCGAKLVHISTDYVYDGLAERPYVECDATNPISVYGRTKLEGESFVTENCSKVFILRTAGVYGEGKNFVKTMLRLAEAGNKLRVVSDQYMTPTSSLELARVIIFLMETDSYGIYHTTCEGETNWYDFAVMIFRMAGKEVPIEAISTIEYVTPAKRPRYSVLVNRELRLRHDYYMKEWKEALREYFKDNQMLIL